MKLVSGWTMVGCALCGESEVLWSKASTPSGLQRRVELLLESVLGWGRDSAGELLCPQCYGH